MDWSVVVRAVEWDVRADAYRLLLEGRSATAISRELDVDRSSVNKWAKLVGMTAKPGSAGGILLPPDNDPRPAPGRSHHHLTLENRTLIQVALTGPEPWSFARIARELGVATSTISREVKRHRIEQGGYRAIGRRWSYHAGVAHHQALTTRHQDRPRKLDDPVLRVQVVELLNTGWSPDAIAGRLKLEFPNEPEKYVSHETIYQALYVQGRGSLREELTVVKALRTGRTARIPQLNLPKRSNRPWLAGAMLSDRPPEAEDRAVPGHWEGDLVVGPNLSGIVTLVERRSRFALIGRLPGTRDSETVIDRMTGMARSLPRALFETVTWDQGVEMAQHVDFTVATGCKVFFCDPHSPWQRGSNENLNRLIREFFPKGTDFNEVTDEELARVQYVLNTRARKTLGYWTPSEKLRDELSVALAP